MSKTLGNPVERRRADVSLSLWLLRPTKENRAVVELVCAMFPLSLSPYLSLFLAIAPSLSLSSSRSRSLLLHSLACSLAVPDCLLFFNSGECPGECGDVGDIESPARDCVATVPASVNGWSPWSK